MSKKHIKIRVPEGDSRNIQDWLFSQGYTWFGRSGYDYLTAKFLYGGINGTLGFGTDEGVYLGHEATEVFMPKEGKPPVGIVPEYVWKAQRLTEILDAIVRFHRAGKDIPGEWINEIESLRKETVK